MSAYIVVDGEVTDPVRYEAYKKLAGLFEGSMVGRTMGPPAESE